MIFFCATLINYLHRLSSMIHAECIVVNAKKYRVILAFWLLLKIWSKLLFVVQSSRMSSTIEHIFRAYNKQDTLGVTFLRAWTAVGKWARVRQTMMTVAADRSQPKMEQWRIFNFLMFHAISVHSAHLRNNSLSGVSHTQLFASKSQTESFASGGGKTLPRRFLTATIW